jgi:hypothetical protein
MAALTEALVQEDRRLHTLTGFLLHFYFIQGPSLLDGATHIQSSYVPPSYYPMYQFPLEKPSQMYSEVCFTNPRHLSTQLS